LKSVISRPRSVAAHLIVVAARSAEERKQHQCGAEQHREPRSERGGDQHVDVNPVVASGDQNHGDRGNDYRQQRHPLHRLLESPQHRRTRAWNRIRLRHALPFGRAS
jgi:hypothetical protein